MSAKKKNGQLLSPFPSQVDVDFFCSTRWYFVFFCPFCFTLPSLKISLFFFSLPKLTLNFFSLCLFKIVPPPVPPYAESVLRRTAFRRCPATSDLTNVRSFFPLPRNFRSFSSLWRSFRGIVVSVRGRVTLCESWSQNRKEIEALSSRPQSEKKKTHPSPSGGQGTQISLELPEEEACNQLNFLGDFDSVLSPFGKIYKRCADKRAVKHVEAKRIEPKQKSTDGPFRTVYYERKRDSRLMSSDITHSDFWMCSMFNVRVYGRRNNSWIELLSRCWISAEIKSVVMMSFIQNDVLLIRHDTSVCMPCIIPILPRSSECLLKRSWSSSLWIRSTQCRLKWISDQVNLFREDDHPHCVAFLLDFNDFSARHDWDYTPWRVLFIDVSWDWRFAWKIWLS